MKKKLKVYLQAEGSTADLSALPDDSLIFGKDGVISIKEDGKLRNFTSGAGEAGVEPEEETETDFIKIITHADGGTTFTAKPEAEDNKLYEVGGEWYFVVEDHDKLKTIVAEFVNLEGESPTASLTDDFGTTKEIPLNQVVTTRVTTLQETFRFASTFNQIIGSWDVSNVTKMNFTFNKAFAFNQYIGNWDTSGLTSLYNTFNEATSFNQELKKWDVSGVTNIESAFKNASAFNQDLSPWDTRSLTKANNTFNEATSFNQDLSGWCVENVASTPSGFDFNTPAWVNKQSKQPKWGQPCKTCPDGKKHNQDYNC